jgi:hypothetical protein
VGGRRESPLESGSSIVMHRFEPPSLKPQVSIYDQRGRFVAKVDFAWLRRGVVGEADGRGKYADGEDPLAVFDAEKDRQARLEALGLVVVRWNGRHLLGDPPVLVQRLRRPSTRAAAAVSAGGRREQHEPHGSTMIDGVLHDRRTGAGRGAGTRKGHWWGRRRPAADVDGQLTTSLRRKCHQAAANRASE